MNVARAISTKNVIPILNGIKFELKEEGLYLTASDSELTLSNFIYFLKFSKKNVIFSIHGVVFLGI